MYFKIPKTPTIWLEKALGESLRANEESEEGLGAGQELVQKRPCVHRGDRKLETGSEGQSPRSRGLWRAAGSTARASQPSLLLEAQPARSGPAPASTDLRSLRWLSSDHCLTGLLPDRPHCTARAQLHAGAPQAEGTQGRALSRAPLWGLQGQGLGELPGDMQRAPTPWQRPVPSPVAAATCPHSGIWTPGGTCISRPWRGPPVSGWDSLVSLKL